MNNYYPNKFLPFLIGAFLCSSLAATAGNVNTPGNYIHRYTTSGAGFATIDTVADISALQGYKSGSTTLVVKDALRGGTFTKSSAGTIDSGTVFNANGGGYWVRQYTKTAGANASWFGIVGNGSTDNTTAFTALFKFASANVIQVNLAAGIYMTKQVTLLSNITLKGASRTTCILKLISGAGANTSLIYINNSKNILFSNVTLDANSGSQTNTGISALYAVENNPTAQIANLQFKNVSFANTKGNNVLLTSYNNNFNTAVIDSCTFTNAGLSALQLVGLTNFSLTNSSLTSYVLTSQATTPAIVLNAQPSYNIHITGNTFLNTVGTEFAIETAQTEVSNSDFSGNTFDAANVGASGISGVFVNCTFTNNKHLHGTGGHRCGYEITGNNVTISGNTINNGGIVCLGSPKTVNGITFSGSFGNGYKITKNTITNTLANSPCIALSSCCSALDSNGARNTVISNNILYDSLGTGNSPAIVLGYYDSPGYTSFDSITNNQIYANATNPGIILISSVIANTNPVAYAPHDITIINNTVYGGRAAVQINNSNTNKGITISNNDFSRSPGGIMFTLGILTKTYKVANNIYYKGN